jgi:2-polyprenyl-6-methoxyphenol hydroxylase-like FAD-dependent oxidoreductase
LEKIGGYMPPPSYRDVSGHILAAPTPDFPDKFPILCLRRDHLLKVLHDGCVGHGVIAGDDLLPPVTIRSGVGVMSCDFSQSASDDSDPGSRRPGVAVNLTDGSSIRADICVAADGIHSALRAQIAPR